MESRIASVSARLWNRFSSKDDGHGAKDPSITAVEVFSQAASEIVTSSAQDLVSRTPSTAPRVLKERKGMEFALSDPSKFISTLTPLPKVILEDDGVYLPILDSDSCAACRDLWKVFTKASHKLRNNTFTVAESVVDGCIVCLWIYKTIYPAWELHFAGGEGARAPKPPNIAWDRLTNSTPDTYGPPVVLALDYPRTALKITFPAISVSSKLSIFIDEGALFSRAIPSRRLPRISTLEQTLASFKVHFDALSKKKIKQPLLSSRILDVGNGSSHVVHLRDFRHNKINGNYICLSHRWAHSNPLTTTQETLSQRLAGIEIDQLSPTLQDAISLTRSLGIQFLWIDSLCILQDSVTDWQIESAKMGHYYRNSWLTIAAGLDNEESGIFGNRYYNDPDSAYYRIHLNTPSDKPQFLYLTGNDESLYDNRGSSLLYTRGWTLQEELLSPRLLSFLPRQTELRIGDKVRHECGYSVHISNTGFLNTEILDLYAWGRIIEDYSKRILTKESDKLPAISGIAQRYALNKPADVYLAGMWRGTLLPQLCWCKVGSYAQGNLLVQEDPRVYRAPSWSWASVDSPVVFEKASDNPLPQSDFSILSASTVLVSSDPYGQVSSGTLTVRAKLSKQLWRRRPGVNGKWYFAHPVGENVPLEVRSANVPFSNATLILDREGEGMGIEMEIWSMEIMREFALALLVVGGEEGRERVFRRIGAICWRTKADRDAMAEVQTVTII